MHQDNAGRRFVDVLATVPARAHKAFSQICFRDTERRHASVKLELFFRPHRECAHVASLWEQARIRNATNIRFKPLGCRVWSPLTSTATYRPVRQKLFAHLAQPVSVGP